MDVGDHDDAARVLRRSSYYRLSGYWYSFRQRTDEGRSDTFYQGTRLGWGA
jgi:abortive infection bacteriophage resistance protein